MATPVHVLSRFRPSLAAALLGVPLATLWLAGGTSRADERGRRVGGQHAAPVHQRDPIAPLALVHEVSRDEDGDAVPA